MIDSLSHRNCCRLCGSEKVEKVVDLAPIPLSENYTLVREDAHKAVRYPVDVYMCAECGHVQQFDVIDSASLWASYTYYSGDAKGMPEHFRDMAPKFVAKAAPGPGALVVDIGSNDGSLLKPFQEAGYRVLGIDPATEVAARANAASIPTIPSLMTLDVARRIRAEKGPASIVCAFNVFAHADDLGEMADCVREMLVPDGLFFFEAQYLLDIIDGVLIATIFHEHMSHHSVTPLIPFLKRHGLELVAIDRSPIQHGSLIGTVQLAGGPRPIEKSVADLLEVEAGRRLTGIATLRAFNDQVQGIRARARDLVVRLVAGGARIAAYGAARSGPTLIAQFGLKDAIEYIVDDHPQKVGKFTAGDGIPIIPTSELLARQPDYTLILAWVHSAKIIETNREYLERGGHFIVLCPQTRVVGKDGDVVI